MIPSVASWLPYMASRVGHAPFTGQDTFGEATYGATTWYPAHIEQAMVQQEGRGMTVVTGQLHLIIGAILAIDPRDHVLVPAPFTTRSVAGVFSTGEDAEVVRVSPSMGPIVGQHHTEVWTQ